VNDNFFHISQLNKTYPLPDIPEDQAWEEMRKLLAEEDETLVPPSVPPIPPDGRNDFWKYGLLILIIAGYLLYNYNLLFLKTKSTAGTEEIIKIGTSVPPGDSVTLIRKNKKKPNEKVNDSKSMQGGLPYISNDPAPTVDKRKLPHIQSGRSKIISKSEYSTITTDPIDPIGKNLLDSGKTETALPEKPGFSKDSCITAIQTKKKDGLKTKKTDPIPKPDVEIHNKRISLAAGLGLNQFFVVGSQQHSDYSSGGTTGTVSDYIPVPFIRSYLNKKLYIQLEAQINTPQYTKQLLAKNEIVSDTGRPGRPTTESAVFINKLFYFNIPLSIHYSIFNKLYIGAGLQFSQLTNGVGLFEGKQYSSLSPDTLTDSKIASIKNDPVYREIKTSEWRILMDINYQWKNFIFGLRYNQSLSNFINVRISSTELTQGRNSSVQLYLRYILWKNNKTKELLSE
jgi:hypothetical protein